jgi:hypothetical protein
MLLKMVSGVRCQEDTENRAQKTGDKRKRQIVFHPQSSIR